MDHVHFSQSRESVTEIRNATRGFKYPAFDACTVLLLNRPSTLGYSNAQPFSHPCHILRHKSRRRETLPIPIKRVQWALAAVRACYGLCLTSLTKCATTSPFKDICLIYFYKISSTQHPYL